MTGERSNQLSYARSSHTILENPRSINPTWCPWDYAKGLFFRRRAKLPSALLANPRLLAGPRFSLSRPPPTESSNRPETCSGLNCFCVGGGPRPRARFAAVAAKLLSALLAHPRLLTGPRCSLSRPTPTESSNRPETCSGLNCFCVGGGARTHDLALMKRSL